MRVVRSYEVTTLEQNVHVSFVQPPHIEGPDGGGDSVGVADGEEQNVIGTVRVERILGVPGEQLGTARAQLGVFVAGQVIEGNVLSPLIVGDRVGLHPVWLMFALFVFAYLFGFVGMLLAVPAAAAIGVLVRFALQKYLQSALYHGSAAGQRRAGKQGG